MNEWKIVVGGEHVVHTFKTKERIVDGDYLVLSHNIYKIVFIVGDKIHCYVEDGGVPMSSGKKSRIHIIEE